MGDANGFGPGGPDPLADLDRGDQIRGGQNLRRHRAETHPGKPVQPVQPCPRDQPINPYFPWLKNS